MFYFYCQKKKKCFSKNKSRKQFENISVGNGIFVLYSVRAIYFYLKRCYERKNAFK